MASVGKGMYGKKRKLVSDDTNSSQRKNKRRKLSKNDPGKAIDHKLSETKTKLDGNENPIASEEKDFSNEFSSTEESLRVVCEFHTLNKRIEQTKNNKYLTSEQKEEKIAKLQKEIEELGGLERYQRASMFGADSNENAGFNSSKWVLQELKFRGYSTGIGTEDFRVKGILDVGAINNQYLHCSSWLEITPIDLNPQHPSVLKADFFEYAKERIDNEKEAYDAIVLSLVVNFVGDIKQRGEMIALCAHPQLLRENGLLFIVLPSACIHNSRYMKYSRFVKIFISLGFTLLSFKLSKKLAFWIFQLTSPTKHYVSGTDSFHFPKQFPKKLVRGGSKCNNFTILIKNTDK